MRSMKTQTTIRVDQENYLKAKEILNHTVLSNHANQTQFGSLCKLVGKNILQEF